MIGNPKNAVRARRPSGHSCERDTGLQPSARLLIAVALTPVAVLLVHEIRYLLAFGDASGTMLAARGHGYLGQLLPPLALTSAVALGGYVARLAHAWQTGSGERPRRRTLVSLWLLSAAGLLAIYAGQETAEALLAQGSWPGLGAAFGSGGLWAVPAAMLLGLLLALLLDGAARVVDLVARRSRARIHPSPRPTIGGPRRGCAPGLDPMAQMAPGRAPPGASVPAIRRLLPAACYGC